MIPTGARPPSPWENTHEDPDPITEAGTAPDPVAVLGDLLLGKAGPPEAGVGQHEIRASSALVLGGVVLGLAGVAAIALGQGARVPQDLREVGGVLGGLGLLTLMWGMLIGLPGHRMLRAIGLTGIVVGVVGLVAFVWAYPQNWGKPGVTDHTVPVLATYVAGVVLLVAATFAALVSDFVLRMQVRSRLRRELGREPTDSEIQADIDYALRRHKVTWGGMAEDSGRGLRFKAEPLPGDWQAVMPRFGRESVASGDRAHAVDQAVDALTNFRGGRVRTGELPEAGLGDAATALKALNAAKAAAPKRSWLDRLLGRPPRPPPGYEPPMGPGMRKGLR